MAAPNVGSQEKTERGRGGKRKEKKGRKEQTEQREKVLDAAFGEKNKKGSPGKTKGGKRKYTGNTRLFKNFCVVSLGGTRPRMRGRERGGKDD